MATRTQLQASASFGPTLPFLPLFADDVFEEGAVRDAVEVGVFGADGDRGVPELLDGALDAVYGDHISDGGAVLNVSPGGDVAGEQREALTEGEGCDEADGREDDHGYEDEYVGLEP